MTEEITTEEKPTPDPSKRRAKSWFYVLILALFLLMAAFSYHYVRLAKTNRSQVRALAQLQTAQRDQFNHLQSLTERIEKLDQSVQKSTVISEEQEKLIAEWHAAQKGDLNKWKTAEALYLVKLANDQLQYTQNIPLAVSLLETAILELENTQENELIAIRQAILNDVTTIKALPQWDIGGLYQQVVAVDNAVDQLPFPSLPFKSDVKTKEEMPANLSWWRAGLYHSFSLLKEVVVIKRNSDEMFVLATPEEKAFLYQNLHAELQSVMWGVLHQDAKVFQTSLARSINWIKKYFVQDETMTQQVLQNLAELQKINFQQNKMTLNNTLQLFNQYLQSSDVKNKVQ